MAPQMLHRVIHGHQDPEPWQKTLLNFRPAILHGWRRHRVRGSDYPAIVAASMSSSADRTSVLGTLVTGLTDGDIHRLDLFEGDEYVRQEVLVRVLRTFELETGSSSATRSEEQLRNVLSAAEERPVSEVKEVKAVTYVWIAGEERLEDAEWDLEAFKRDKLASWVGMDESEW